MRTACELRICSSWCMQLKIFNILSEQQQQRDDNLTTHQSPLVSAIHVNCKFALRGRDSFRSSELLKETNALNSCNKWPVYSTNTHPVAVDTCTHWVPIFIYFPWLSSRLATKIHHCDPLFYSSFTVEPTSHKTFFLQKCGPEFCICSDSMMLTSLILSIDKCSCWWSATLHSQAIHGYREAERSRWTPENLLVFKRIKDLAFKPEEKLLSHAHVLDLDKKGWVQVLDWGS